jgi:CelD/BcsL family acetyltransferase involved in cellulose biosynthesis
LKTTVIPAALLTEAHERDWLALIDSNPDFASPFFTLEFTRSLAGARPDVFVLCLESGGRFVGFLPFQRDRAGVGRPLGLRISDFQGLIAAPNADWDVRSLLREAGLRVWHFDHLLASQRSFDPFVLRHDESSFMDLSYGYDHYVNERKRAGSRFLSQLERKARKIEREIGPLRFEWHTDESEVFEALRAWKTAQREDTRTFNVLDYDWVRDLLEKIRHDDTPEFGGVLSALYADDRLIAAHLGMRSRRVFHYWFPGFERSVSRHSPGGILLIHIAKRCAELGIERIDLGKGDERYKRSFQSGTIGLSVGAADSRPLHVAARRAWFRALEWGRESRLRSQLKGPKRILERIKGNTAMR